MSQENAQIHSADPENYSDILQKLGIDDFQQLYPDYSCYDLFVDRDDDEETYQEMLQKVGDSIRGTEHIVYAIKCEN